MINAQSNKYGMKRHLLFLAICLFLNPVLSAAYPSENRDSIPVNDGPYITFLNDTLKVLRIENSLVREEYLLPGRPVRNWDFPKSII